MANVAVACQALNSTGRLWVPFVVSWDNQASPTGLTCTSIASPVPGTKSKCNAPVIGLTPQVIVLPTITKTDGRTQITPGETTTYTIAITNNTGIVLSTANGNAAVFKDPAVSNLAVSSVTCAVTSGTATCPSAGSVTVAAMQGGGITIPSMANGSIVTFTVTAQLNGAAVRYDVSVTHTGPGTVNANTLFIVDAIPAHTDLYVSDIAGAGSGPVAFSNGTPTSALTYTFTSLASTTDDVAFSSDGGATFTYTPVANANGVDPNVTHVRINPKGIFAGDPVAGAPSPSCTASFRVRIE